MAAAYGLTYGFFEKAFNSSIAQVGGGGGGGSGVGREIVTIIMVVAFGRINNI